MPDTRWEARQLELERWRTLLHTIVDDTIGNLLDDGEEGGAIRDFDSAELTVNDLLTFVADYVEGMSDAGSEADIVTLETDMG